MVAENILWFWWKLYSCDKHIQFLTFLYAYTSFDEVYIIFPSLIPVDIPK